MILQDSKNIGVRRTINDYNATSSFDAILDNPAGRHAESFNLNDDIVVYADNGSYVWEPCNQLGSWNYGFNSTDISVSTDYSLTGSSFKLITVSGTTGYGTAYNYNARLFYDLPTLTSGTKIGFNVYFPGSAWYIVNTIGFSIGSVVGGANQCKIYKNFSNFTSGWNKCETYLGSMSCDDMNLGSLNDDPDKFFAQIRLTDSYNAGSLGGGSYAIYYDDFYIQSEDGANKRLFKGVVEDITFDGSGLKERVTISGRDLGAILQDNTVSPIVFKNTDSGQIARQIINQNVEDSRISTSTLANTGVVIEKITFSHISVYDALSKLAELSGFYWYVNEWGKVYFIEKESYDSGVLYGTPVIGDIITHWKMNTEEGGNEITDSIGESNGIIDTTIAQFVPGLRGNCLEFLSSDGIGVPATSSSDAELNKIGGTYNQYSISLWVESSTTTADLGRIFEKTGSGVYPFVVRWTSSGRLQCAIFDGANNPNVASTNSLADDKWHHAVFTVDRDDAQEVSIYIDAQFNESMSDTTSGDISNTAGVAFGNTGGLNREFVGKIDDVRFYKKALSAEEVNSLYQGGLGTELDYASHGAGNVTDGKFKYDDSQIFNEIRVYGDNQLIGKRQFLTPGVDSTGSVLYLDGKPHNIFLSISGTNQPIQPGGIYNINNPEWEDVKYLVDFQNRRVIMTSGANAGNNLYTGSTIQFDYQVSVPILSIKRDIESQEEYGIKEKVIIDRNIKDPVESQAKAQAFLTENKDAKIAGDLDIKGVINVFPGYTATVNLPNMGIEYETYTINEADYNFNVINNNKGRVLNVKVNKKIGDITDTIKEQMLRLRMLETANFDADIANIQAELGSVGISGITTAYTHSVGSGFYFHLPNHNKLNSPSSLLGPWIGGSTAINLN